MNNQDGESTAKTEPKESRRKFLLIGGVVAIGLLVVGLLVYKNATAVDEDKVDASLAKLDLATRGIELNKKTAAIANSNLASPKTAKRTAGAMTQLKALQAQASKVEDPAELTDGLDGTEAALDSITATEKRIRLSNKLISSSTKKDVPRLAADRKALGGSVAKVTIGAPLVASFSAYGTVISASLEDLEEEDSLPDDRDPEAVLTELSDLKGDVRDADQPAKKQIKKVVQHSKQVAYEHQLVEGPKDCGDNADGEAVFLNSGRTTCPEVLAVATQTNGLGNGLFENEPAGWTCEGLPITPSGNTGTYQQGFSCTSTSAQVSVFGSRTLMDSVDQDAADRAEAEAAAAAAEEDDHGCGPGEVYSPAPHLKHNPCVVQEGAEEE